mmetsp:Transcript_1498/g.4234  ORF Transcript_1498/g.4234 Transcript_1498/m.4234 type:complete len:225 (-) Transcript_1498:540-1214(-)
MAPFFLGRFTVGALPAVAAAIAVDFSASAAWKAAWLLFQQGKLETPRQTAPMRPESKAPNLASPCNLVSSNASPETKRATVSPMAAIEPTIMTSAGLLISPFSGAILHASVARTKKEMPITLPTISESRMIHVNAPTYCSRTPAFASVNANMPRSTKSFKSCSNACSAGICFGLLTGGRDGIKGTTKQRASAGWRAAPISPSHVMIPPRNTMVTNAACGTHDEG